MSQLSSAADDLKSVEGQYIRLIENELFKILGRVNGRQPITTELKARVRQTAVEIYSITNASFENNYNPHHGDER